MAERFKSPVTYLLLCLVLLCSVGIYQAFRVAMADFIGYKAGYALNGWEKARKAPTPDQAAKALDDITAALAWTPDNPQLLERKALILMNSAAGSVTLGEFRAATEEGITLYRQAVQLRPRWPHTWANLALLKAYRQEFDAEFADAVVRAVQYGPWEPSIHRVITEVGMMGWPALTQDTRTHIADNVYRGLRFMAKPVMESVKRHQRVDVVCALLPLDPRTRALCGGS